MECLRVDPSQISLPVGECGKIHVKDKATEIKVEMRNFLKTQDICTDADCDMGKSSKIFSKNKLSAPMIQGQRSQCSKTLKKLEFFEDKLCKALLDFIATEEKKYTDETVKDFKATGPVELADMPCIECRGQPCNYNCRNFIVFSLYTRNQLDHLLWLDSQEKVSISEALCRTYGGQAVGNGYQFLVIHHLLPFYIAANAIIACGYESCEEKWGLLSRVKVSYCFMKIIEYDCDFQTFIPSLRPYLHKDVFMRDANKTNKLLKEVFRHIYVYFFLKRKFCGLGDQRIRDEIKWTIQRCFNFPYQYK